MVFLCVLIGANGVRKTSLLDIFGLLADRRSQDSTASMTAASGSPWTNSGSCNGGSSMRSSSCFILLHFSFGSKIRTLQRFLVHDGLRHNPERRAPGSVLITRIHSERKPF